MTDREHIIEVAKKCNVSIRDYYDETGSTPAELERFYHAARNEALKVATEKCDEIAKEHERHLQNVYDQRDVDMELGEQFGAEECHDAILAMIKE